MTFARILICSAALAGCALGTSALAQQRAAPPPPPIGADSAGMFFISYPRAALQRREEGAVHYRVSIDREGRPLDCTVVRSSGSPRLDSISCAAVVHHARFVLPPNPTGNPERPVYVGRVDWRLQ